MQRSKGDVVDNKLQQKINELHELFMPVDLNSAYQRKKKQALKKLKDLTRRYDRKELQETNFEDYLVCALVLVFYFGMRLKLTSAKPRVSNCCDRLQFRRVEAEFQKVVKSLLPERDEVAIKIVLSFFSETDLWPHENFAADILEVIFYYDHGKIKLFNLMLSDANAVSFTSIKSARHRMRILYKLLDSKYWVTEKQTLLPFLTRLLDMFLFGMSGERTALSEYKYLQKGYEVCLRRIFAKAENRYRLSIITTMVNWFLMVKLENGDVRIFSSLLDSVASLYNVKTYCESFNGHLIDHIMDNLIGSSKESYSYLGCRLLQRLLDRGRNINYLMFPMIYYEFSQVCLRVGRFNHMDKMFLRKHRAKLHKCVIKATFNHWDSVSNVKMLFSIISCIVLEVPSGLSAATAAYILMSIQDFALNGSSVSTRSRFWLHAVVVSIMSLICWVHKAQVLYRYVRQIVSRRAEEAPFLNPPLMQVYRIDPHSVTWNKPTLFFEDWELRYGLWKHFRENETHVSSQVRIMGYGISSRSLNDNKF